VLETVLTALNVPKYWLVAHNIGARVAFSLALRYQDRLHGVALLDAGIPRITLPDAIPTDPERAWKTWHLEGAGDDYLAGHGAGLDEFVGLAQGGGVDRLQAARHGGAQHAVVDQSGGGLEQLVLGGVLRGEQRAGEHHLPVPGQALRVERLQVQPLWRVIRGGPGDGAVTVSPWAGWRAGGGRPRYR
jgi:pimeloyl-ACP methyl ester carboxylesterase